MTTLGPAWEALDAGDIPHTIALLRNTVDEVELRELGRIVEQMSRTVGLADLRAVASTLSKRPDDPQALFDFGYGCIERGIPFLAVPALRAGLARMPDDPIFLAELASALEREFRHREAAEVLLEHRTGLREWPIRYLLVRNLLFAHDLESAEHHFALLPDSTGTPTVDAYQQVRHMLWRAKLITPGPTDARDWHFILRDSQLVGQITDITELATGLGHLLSSARLEPRTVTLLPDLASEELGRELAARLALPTQDFDPDANDTLIVAEDLGAIDPQISATLGHRPAGQLLYEHVCEYPRTPTLCADITGAIESLANPMEFVDAVTDPADSATIAAFVASTAPRWRSGERQRLASPYLSEHAPPRG